LVSGVCEYAGWIFEIPEGTSDTLCTAAAAILQLILFIVLFCYQNGFMEVTMQDTFL
jgi:hypothetical protein